MKSATRLPRSIKPMQQYIEYQKAKIYRGDKVEKDKLLQTAGIFQHFAEELSDLVRVVNEQSNRDVETIVKRRPGRPRKFLLQAFGPTVAV